MGTVNVLESGPQNTLGTSGRRGHQRQMLREQRIIPALSRERRAGRMRTPIARAKPAPSWQPPPGANLISPHDHSVMLASARAGNVIGGGDWAPDRLIPDCVAALVAGRPIEIRNPHATRPWQHVLDPLNGYLILAERLFNDGATFARAWNFGPSTENLCSGISNRRSNHRAMGLSPRDGSCPTRPPCTKPAASRSMPRWRVPHLGWAPYLPLDGSPVMDHRLVPQLPRRRTR